MPTTVRERQARLLADSRSAEARARLAQAVSRAEFLLRLSRTVSAIQNPQRALEALVALLLDEMVDVAQVVVRAGSWQLICGAVTGQDPTCSAQRSPEDAPLGLDDVLRRGMYEEVVLPPAGRARRTALERLLEADLVDEVDQLRAEELAILPLTARGRTFGLLVLGRSPGYTFSGSHSFLTDLADRVAVGVDATLVVAESRHVANVLRASLAPVDPPVVAGLDLATYYRVAHQSEALGGDFLDVHGPDDDLLLLCGDVAGKGVEAAVHAKRIRNATRTASVVDRSPGAILRLVNRVLVAEASRFDEGLATAVCARLRPGDGGLDVDIANAGHPHALVIRSDGAVETVPTWGVALALLEESEYPETSARLRAGDTLMLYSDGVTHARGADGLFGDKRLLDHLSHLGGLPAQAIVESVAVAVSEHVGDRQHDDIAILAARYRPVTS
ncbi:PP2C family protein-serine/threonine phosphatase [Nocardioides sp.]|uniref:PP2C family protein-serine/threonine phosphatase n=1 Tax=Nocardioides sp. TaxID=35761 RepID=UPI0035620BC7